MSSETADEIIENEIKANLASIDQRVRPNKLRKLICKKVKGTNWTQYQRVLDSMIEKGIIQTKKDDGETKIQPLKKDTIAASSAPRAAKSEMISTEMEVPFAIIKYISRKGAKKRKNIENNTKTTILYDDETTTALKRNSSGVETSILTITKTLQVSDQGEDKKKLKRQAKTQVKYAKLFISKMINSYKENPDHFATVQSGGTLEEQAEAKKRKLDAAKNAKKKKHKKIGQNVEENDAVIKSKKKKQRKFY